MSVQSRLTRLLLYAALCLAALFMVFPILYAVSISLMPPAEVNTFPPRFLPSSPRWANYAEVARSVPVGRYLLNSLVVSSAVTLGQIATASLSAYAFAFMNFRGKAALFALFMSTMMVPWEVTLIPNYLTIRSLRLLDSYTGLVLPFLATAFGTFLLRQFFLQIPRELEEAARIDGCGRFRFFWSIALPLARPGLLTLGAYTFLSTWNQYLWPLLVTNTRLMRTVQIGVRFLMNEEGLQYHRVMAGVVLCMAPALVVLVLGQRYLVRGLMAGGLKG
ncbi:carbohydrate ABC transporter permease [Symbiobacterium thermophilum]|uniref:Glycerol-3-phosphate ABC transporter permease protein n=2 Tax=Symbiobacterium thermophilum TaxID=2734 RepID=Q67MC8_SYMTH|nr:carbohydrate ABC transporter permease [Symbiobacterium thermophilum]BAD41165.1 glycerol-3-phosphate ABC transporter permease protein [Symbiobacterium thermophilum IAM 14863]